MGLLRRDEARQEAPGCGKRGAEWGNLLLSWVSQGDTSYQVVYKDNLTDTSWTPVGGLVSGTGGTVTAPAIPTTSAKRFYSVLTQ